MKDILDQTRSLLILEVLTCLKKKVQYKGVVTPNESFSSAHFRINVSYQVLASNDLNGKIFFALANTLCELTPKGACTPSYCEYKQESNDLFAAPKWVANPFSTIDLQKQHRHISKLTIFKNNMLTIGEQKRSIEYF